MDKWDWGYLDGNMGQPPRWPDNAEYMSGYRNGYEDRTGEEYGQATTTPAV